LISHKEKQLINFSKYRLLVEFVNDLLQYQNVTHSFKVNEKIRSFLLEDIENCFQIAQQDYYNKQSMHESSFMNNSSSSGSDLNELSSSSAAARSARDKTPAEIVESWLYDRSCELEPNDLTKFPRVRNYPLKSPPPLSLSKHKSQQASHLFHRSNSANRIDITKQSLQKSSSSNTSTLHTSTTNQSINSVPISIAKSTINSSTSKSSITSSSIMNLAKSSNDDKKSTKQVSTITTTTIKTPKHPLSLQQLRSSKSNRIDMVIPSFELGNPPPPRSTSSTSCSPPAQSPKIPQTPDSILMNTTTQFFKKLSLSSADSSSSAPNSPPPNYDDLEVFELSNVSSSVSAAALNTSQTIRCYDNRMYYHHQNHSSSSSSSSINTRLTVGQCYQDNEQPSCPVSSVVGGTSESGAAASSVGGASRFLDNRSQINNYNNSSNIFTFSPDVVGSIAAPEPTSLSSNLVLNIPSTNNLDNISPIFPIQVANNRMVNLDTISCSDLPTTTISSSMSTSSLNSNLTLNPPPTSSRNSNSILPPPPNYAPPPPPVRPFLRPKNENSGQLPPVPPPPPPNPPPRPPKKNP
jgi:hypothetical protein